MKFLNPDQYQPEAQKLFLELKIQILKHLPFARLEHIGSSSFDNCISKGDLDIFVGVSREKFLTSILAIETLGFNIKEGSLRNNELCPFESLNYKRDVGIQLVVNGSQFEDFLVFRDQIQAHPHLLAAYNKLKYESTGLESDEYRKIKSVFIEKILADKR